MQVRGVKEEEYEDENYEITKVYSLNTQETPAETEDPFAANGTFQKSLKELKPTVKAKITRFEKKLENSTATAGSKRIEDDIITGYNAYEVVLPPENMDSLARLYLKSAPHYAAVNAKVANIVGLGYDFVESPETKLKLDQMEDKTKADKYRKKLHAEKIRMNKWLDSLNAEDSFFETMTKVWRDYEATGNGFIEIGRTITGEVGYVGHIPCTTLRVRRERDGFVQIIANKAVFFRNFGDKTTDNPLTSDESPNELIHIKKYAPGNTFYGLPDIIPAIQAVAGNKFASDFNLEYFENKAVPRHVITLKGATINPSLAKNVLEFFETIKGKNHRSIFIPLPADSNERKVEFKIEAVEAGIQDSSFNNYLKNNLSTILMAHRVPISKIGLAEGVSLAVARDADKTFKEQVAQPEQRMFEQKINRIIAEVTDMLTLKLNELTLTDENTQSQIDERRRKTGTETANEQRARRGMPGIKGGDELVDLNAQAKKIASDNRAAGNRERDSQRSAAQTDSQGEGRSTQGEGRTNSVS